MKLSEAILRGCEMTPKQAFGKPGKFGVETCVLAAAREAVGGQCDLSITHYFPGLPYDIMDRVIELNDGACWSRERIAGWLSEKGL